MTPHRVDTRGPASIDFDRVGEVHQVLNSHRLGGASLMAIGLAEHVRDRGARSVVWVPQKGPASEALGESGVSWNTYSLDRLRGGRLSHALALATIARRLLRGDRAVVHVHNPLVYGMLSPMLRFSTSKRVVHFHIDPSDWEIRWALRHPPHAVVTCSEHIATQVRAIWSHSRGAMSVVAIQNAIDVDRYSPGDRLLASLTSERPVVLMMANLAEHKGQVTALKAIKILKDDGIAVDCWLAGEERSPAGAFTRHLHQLVEELEIGSQVRFLGFREDGPDLLRAADFFLLPSTHEGLPLSIVEAQAVGAVVVASPLPGIREVVEDGVTGFLVDPADPRGYADRIKTLLAKRDLWEQVVRNARAHVERAHSWRYYTERVWQLYADAVAGRLG